MCGDNSGLPGDPSFRGTQSKLTSVLQFCAIINKRGTLRNVPELAREGFPKEVAPGHSRGMSRSQPGEEWPSSKSGSMCKGKKQQGWVNVWQEDRSPTGLASGKGWS